MHFCGIRSQFAVKSHSMQNTGFMPLSKTNGSVLISSASKGKRLTWKTVSHLVHVFVSSDWFVFVSFPCARVSAPAVAHVFPALNKAETIAVKPGALGQVASFLFKLSFSASCSSHFQLPNAGHS